MYSYREEKHLPYAAQDLFSLVADVQNYPEFIPGCDAVKILSSSDNEIIADLLVSYKAVCTKYTSKVCLLRAISEDDKWVIDVTQKDGPFKFLKNRWEFKWNDKIKKSHVAFSIEFEMRSKILNFTIGVMFEKLVKKMVSSFENRAKKILG